MTSIENLPYPKVPLGIGHSLWSYSHSGNFEIKLMLLHGITRSAKNIVLSRELVHDGYDLKEIVQLLADRAILEMLHGLDELSLKQPILDRLEKALASLKSRCEVYEKSGFGTATATELRFFIEYVEGYVMLKPSEERYSNVQRQQ